VAVIVWEACKVKSGKFIKLKVESGKFIKLKVENGKLIKLKVESGKFINKKMLIFGALLNIIINSKNKKHE